MIASIRFTAYEAAASTTGGPTGARNRQIHLVAALGRRLLPKPAVLPAESRI
jgi:hypothetical protein